MKRCIGPAAPPLAVVALVALLSGCRSDLSHQLLERELRMQEDQIYQLQDELQNASMRLDRTARENTSLRRQLGFTDGDPAPRGRGGPPAGPAPRPAPQQPLLVPPAIEVPGVGSPALNAAPAPAALPAPGGVAPPRLDGVPPLPTEPRFPGAAAPAAAAVIPASATEAVTSEAAADTAGDETGGGPPVRPRSRAVSPQESLADAGRITHIVINPARTECFDGDGDGASDGLAIVIEPRDGDERLVTAAGDLSLSVFETSDPQGAAPVARWEIPAQEALAHFRRTSRNRGLHFVLRWPGSPPQGAHVRVHAVLTTFEAASFETDCTVTAKP